MPATSNWDPLTIWTAVLVIFTFPSGYLAWVTVHDRRVKRHRDEVEAEERTEEQKILLMVGKAFFGDDRSHWPSPDDMGGPPMTEVVQSMAHQVKPSNGTTVATMVEQIREMVTEQTEQVDDLREGMAKIAMLVAEHVSDGHGGQKSW